MTDEIQFLPPATIDKLAAQDDGRFDHTVTLHIASDVWVNIGSFLDAVEKMAEAAGLRMIVTVPGYLPAFYGWEPEHGP